jgi:glutathione S-transferase
VATLYRCRTPTDWLCRCGTVARRLRREGIDFDEVRVPFPKSERPEVERLTGQHRVPVLVLGEEVIHDSHRILEHLSWLEQERARSRPGAEAPLGRPGEEPHSVGVEAAGGGRGGRG